MQCIFEPGFSTAAKVTQVSGRGIGMDVVRSDIAALGGRVDVATTSQNVESETWETSTSMPSSFIRRTTRLPNPVSPPPRRGSVAEPAQSFPLFQVRVM